MAKQSHSLKGDFRNFLWRVWGCLGLPDPSPLQYDIADYLQSGPPRRIVMAGRGEGKTYVTAAYVVWRLWKNPDLAILVVSATDRFAGQMTTFMYRILSAVPEVNHLRPNTDQRQSTLMFDVGPARPKHAPSVKSASITGQITGSRADLIVGDDVEVPNNAGTATARANLEERVAEFASILKEGGETIFLGTPHTEDTLYYRQAQKGFALRIWPALYPDLGRIVKYQGNLAPFIADRIRENPLLAGQVVDTAMFSAETMAQKRLEHGNAGFQLQFMLDPMLADEDRYPLKLRDLIVTDLDPSMAPAKLIWSTHPDHQIRDLPCVGMPGDLYFRPSAALGAMGSDGKTIFQPYQGIILAIDPSGRGHDETGWAVVAFLEGYLFLLSAGGIKGGYDDSTLEFLAKQAMRWKCHKVIVEANFGDGMWTKLFQPVLHRRAPDCSLEEVKASNQMHKEKRIADVLEPVISQHRLVVDISVIQDDYDSISPEIHGTERAFAYRLFYQMSRLTRDKGALARDDRLEALAWAVSYWTTKMVADVEKSVQQHENRVLDAAIAEIDKMISRDTAVEVAWSTEGYLGDKDRPAKSRFGGNLRHDRR